MYESSFTLIGLLSTLKPMSNIDRCSSKPNCVSSIDSRGDFYIEPLEAASLQKIKKVCLSMPGANIESESDDFLHIIFTSKLLKFKDDLKVKINGEKIDISSQSRTGHSDLGINKKRVEQIRRLLEK